MKKSLNPIPPTQRGKKRYIKFVLENGSELEEKEVRKELFGVFSSLFGDVGIAKQKLWLMKWFPEKGEGIVRCALEETENVKAGLLFFDNVSGNEVLPVILGVSGSIKKLKE